MNGNSDNLHPGKNNIYLTTDKGHLLLIDIASGQTIKILKIDKEKISRPFVENKNLYIKQWE